MRSMDFYGKVVIVTGSGRGIGKGYAHYFSRLGASIVINDSGVNTEGRGESAIVAEEVCDEIVRLGGTAVFSSHSVCSEDGAKAIVNTAIDSYGKIDAIVNNAGIYSGGSITELDIDTFRRHLDVHILGTLLLSREAWPYLASTKGRIVNTISGSIFGMPNYASYSAAKGGVLGLTKSLAVEGRDFDIAVNCVAPSASTRLTRIAMADAPKEKLDEFERKMPPDSIAPVVAYLSHSDCSLSGECLSVSGKRITRYFIGETAGITLPAITPELIRENIFTIANPLNFSAWPDTKTLEDIVL